MLEVQRQAAVIVRSVLGGRSLDAELSRTAPSRAGWATSERAALQDICYGTLRFLGRLNALLEALLDRPVRDEKLRSLLRVALYQLEYTRAPPYAIIDHAVDVCARLAPGAKGLVNGVLRSFLRRRAAVIAVADRTETGRFSYPQWWIDKVRNQYPDQYAGILNAGNLHPPLTLRVNCRRSNPGAYLRQLTAHGLKADRIGESAVRLAVPVPVDRVPGFSDGLVSVQDAGAQRAAELIDLADGQRVLDACAAPGGKAAHMCELADVDLVALDADAARLERVQQNFARLGLRATLLCGDACAPESWWDGRPFDRILVDAPCSASGVVRRHPDIKWLRRASDLAHFAATQSRMLDALWRLVPSGGKLLYATCSVFQEENHLQVVHFLERKRDARCVSLPGTDSNQPQHPGQMLPDDRHDGFFFALLQKQ